MRGGCLAAAVGAMCACIAPGSAAARPDTNFVRAGANPGGTGSHAHPFGALAEVQAASDPGDRIVVLKPAKGAPALDGGIAVKPRQHLTGAGRQVTAKHDRKRDPTLTNSTTAAHNGDAVALARRAVVENLRVAARLAVASTARKLGAPGFTATK